MRILRNMEMNDPNKKETVHAAGNLPADLRGWHSKVASSGAFCLLSLHYQLVFHGNIIQKPALIPCCVPLINLNNTHKDHILNISLSFCTSLLYAHILNGCVALHSVHTVDFSWTIILRPASRLDAFNHEKMFLKLNINVTWFIFLAIGLLRLIACMMTNIWPYKLGHIVYTSRCRIYTLLYSGNLLKSQ